MNFPFRCTVVSIPHRYAENQVVIPPRNFWQTFQFLIGTLKTEMKERENLFLLLFQFLIGTLKTAQVLGVSHRYHIVSIPHRYAENKYFPTIAEIREAGFNSS